MIEQVEELLKKVDTLSAKTAKEAEDLRIKYLGKKGEITQLFNEFKSVPNEEKKQFGQLLNQLKQKAQTVITELKSQTASNGESTQQLIDLTRPVNSITGTRHPLAVVRNEIISIFNRIGFTISEGPEIEDDWHNFTALNFPEEHPARDMKDTFFISKDHALRTHTSSVQVRVMENSEPPIRTISPGRVFRNEAISARAHCIFHQVEGLYIDKDLSLIHISEPTRPY